MTDAEITRLCAEAMPEWQRKARRYGMKIDPLHRKEQALELLEVFELRIGKARNGGRWVAFCDQLPVFKPNLLRAICVCVALKQIGTSR